MAIEFRFTPEQKLFRRTIRKFLHEEVAPHVKEDKSGHGTFHTKAVELLQEHGLLGVPIPRKYGGAGMGEVGYCIAMEEVGSLDTSLSTVLGAHTGIGVSPIWLFGNEEQRERIVRPLASGEALAAFALTEPQAGSDAAGIKTKAEKDGNEWIINGRKIWCSNGDRADFILVMAVTDSTLGARGGVTSFVVEKGMEGFEVIGLEDKMGIRSSSTAELAFKDCRVPKENIIGNVGEGFIVALTALDGGRAGLAAASVGPCKHMLKRALEYAAKRKRGGRPLSDHQAVQWKLANIAADIYRNELAAYDTATLVNDYYHRIADRKPVPRALRDEVSRKCAMIKYTASEDSGTAIEDLMQIMGAAGIRDSWGIEIGYRDQAIGEIFEGTNEIQRLIVSRDLVKNGSWW